MNTSTIEYGRAHFTGAPIATCTACGWVCVHWDDDDLVDGHLYHECTAGTVETPTGRATCGHVDMLGALTGTPCGKCTRKRHRAATR